MLHLRKVLGAKPKEHTEAELRTLMTPWGESLDPNHVLEEHPTPQFARKRFSTLNGYWDCVFLDNAYAVGDDLVQAVRDQQAPDACNERILVPFSPEAALSGIGRQLKAGELLWYRQSFPAPSLDEGERCILHFQAVDAVCACRCNGQLIGSHFGGYTPFSFDITDMLALADDHFVLEVCVADPSEAGGQLRGKQRIDRGDIWYTAQSGIWQTVWYEIVAAAHIVSAELRPDPDTGMLSIDLQLDPGQAHKDACSHALLKLGAAVADASGTTVAHVARTVKGETSCTLDLSLDEPHLWSPDDPYLYSIELTYDDDRVASYCGFRTVEVARDRDGIARFYLNHEPLFVKGVLDQAYWSDGLMTAPADDALIFDIQAMRDDGFNMMRKHIKVECARWYYHCDRLGMLVWQDMVNGGDGEIKTWDWSYKPTLFKFSWGSFNDRTPKNQQRLGAGEAAYQAEWTHTCKEVIALLRNHPSVVTWVLFNEGWGQFDARAATELVRSLDTTRPVDAVSGWYDQQCGDFYSVHNYFRDFAVWPDKAQRAFVISEFGGFSHHVDAHSALDEAYGYEMYDDLDEWRRAVRALLDEATALAPQGLAGYVYTQVSDIEEETNGILTYDRRVNKLAE